MASKLFKKNKLSNNGYRYENIVLRPHTTAIPFFFLETAYDNKKDINRLFFDNHSRLCFGELGEIYQLDKTIKHPNVNANSRWEKIFDLSEHTSTLTVL